MLSFLQACFVITLSSGDFLFTYIYIYINKAIAERIKKKKSIDDLLLFFFHSPQDGCDNPVSHVLPFG